MNIVLLILVKILGFDNLLGLGLYFLTKFFYLLTLLCELLIVLEPELLDDLEHNKPFLRLVERLICYTTDYIFKLLNFLRILLLLF